jgi:DNA phosphorothioation-associated putative methyltransferase
MASPTGKLLPTALYVHVDAVGDLSLPLRLYEGCARAALGAVDGATIVKLRRDEPKVSYLSYPDFDRVAHPALAESVSVHLQTFRGRTRRYDASVNPPVLHRKEAFVSEHHPLRERFARLTRAEEREGLYADTSTIGTRAGWNAALGSAGLQVVGHRLMRTRT